MNFEKIPPQESWFWQEGWNAEKDKFFVEGIEVYKKELPWEGADIPDDVLEDVRHSLNEAFEINMTWEDVLQRVQMLKTRYKTFKWLGSDNRAVYHHQSNTVYASKPNWGKLFQDDYFAQAYYREGEPLFTKLAFLFGQDDVKFEHGDTVILISDSTRSSGLGKNVVQNLSDDDEVTSPLGITTRRNLFGKEGVAAEQYPGNDESFVLVNEVGSKKINATVNPAKKDGSSSCASSSPSMGMKLQSKFRP